MIRKLFMAAALLAPSPALAQPVYLTCEFEGRANAYPIELVADEDTGIVTMTVPRTGFSDRYRAIFSRDKLMFDDGQSQLTISRINLSITRVTPIIKTVDNGQCAVVEKPKRAF